jgi:uncharacterized damage-inducible protein DinB
MAADSPFFALSSAALLEHWQGHRRLPRRVIDAFPDNHLFTHSVGGMRPFGALALEIINMASVGMQGLTTRTWVTVQEAQAGAPTATTKSELLALWDATTKQIEAAWPHIPAGRFGEIDKAFGQWEGPVHALFLYWIDNEIHHRGQGYVYLRALGITPPHFFERT